MLHASEATQGYEKIWKTGFTSWKVSWLWPVMPIAFPKQSFSYPMVITYLLHGKDKLLRERY